MNDGFKICGYLAQWLPADYNDLCGRGVWKLNVGGYIITFEDLLGDSQRVRYKMVNGVTITSTLDIVIEAITRDVQLLKLSVGGNGDLHCRMSHRN